MARQRKHRIPTTPSYPPLPEAQRKALLGPPTKYHAGVPQGLLEAAADGFSFSAYAGKIGVSPSTLREWASSFPEMTAASARAKAARLYWFESQAIEYIKERSSGPVSLLIYGLKNAGPDEWRDRIEIENTHKVDLASLIEQSMTAKGRVIDVTPKSLTEQSDNGHALRALGDAAPADEPEPEPAPASKSV